MSAVRGWSRRGCLVLGLGLVVVACGGGEMSEAEYVAEVNAIVDRAARRYVDLVASPEGRVLVIDAEHLDQYTPEDLRSALEQVREIERDVEEATAAMEPPGSVADLHWTLFEFEGDFITAQEALARRAGTAADWEELSATPEMAAYRQALAVDKQTCTETQLEMNAQADSAGFAIDAWLSAEMKGVVEAVLGCHGYPAYPEDVYRPPAGS